MRLIKQIFLISFIIISCQKQVDLPQHSDLSYSVVKKVSIEFQSDELPNLNHIQQVEACLLASFNKNHQELVLFNYCEDKELKKTIKLPRDGVNYIGEMEGAYYINSDSIFFTSDTRLKLYLVDSACNVKNSWDFEDNYLPEQYIQADANSYYTIIVGSLPDVVNYPFLFDTKKESLFFSIFCISNLKGYQEFETIYASPNIVEIPLNKSKERKFFGLWPESYRKDEIPYNPMVNFALSAEGLPIINYHYDDNIYDASNAKFHSAKSKYSNSDFSLFNKNDTQTNDELEVKTYTLDESYVDIIYDSYKKLYYRVFKKTQLDSNIPGEKPIKTDAEWSIIVLDAAFQVLGEVKFEKKKYNFLKILPTKEGILIAQNRNNTYTDENTVGFDLVKINY
jgi:hypothetical protein